MIGSFGQRDGAGVPARRVAGVVGTTVLAAVLLVLVFQVAGGSGQAVAKFLSQNGLTLGVVAALSIGLQSWLSAAKWRALLDHLNTSGTPVPIDSLVVYSTLATLCAQLLPSPVAVTLVRGYATKHDLGGSFVHGAALGIYDQIFDVGILLLVALGSFGLYALGASPSAAIAAAAALLALAMMVSRPLFHWLKPLALLQRSLPTWLPGSKRIESALDFAHRSSLDSAKMAATLTRLSIMRYLVIGARSVTALMLAVPLLAVFDAAWGFGLVQASSLLALTPGNIGVTEWGWAGIEHILRVEPGRFVVAIVALRVATACATLIVLACSWLFMTGRKRGRDIPPCCPR